MEHSNNSGEELGYKDQCRVSRSPTTPQRSAIKLAPLPENLPPSVHLDQPCATTFLGSQPAPSAPEAPTQTVMMAEAQLVTESVLPRESSSNGPSTVVPPRRFDCSRTLLSYLGVALGGAMGGSLVTAVIFLVVMATNSGVSEKVSSSNIVVVEPNTAVPDTVVLVGDTPVSDFPISIPYDRVQAPRQLPFEIHGSFLADPATPNHSGLVDHEDCPYHETCEGFKVFLDPDGRLGCLVSQYTSYYTSAFSDQDSLIDGKWHNFVCKVEEEFVLVQVDGLDGLPKGTSDERGVQNPKIFGRVVHSGPYIIGDDPGASASRRLVGQVKNVIVVNTAS